MPTQVNLYDLHELSNEDSKNEFYLDTKYNTRLHIIAQSDRTIIKFPFFNKFELVNGMIIIHKI